jgi:hypothetical protein
MNLYTSYIKNSLFPLVLEGYLRAVKETATEDNVSVIFFTRFPLRSEIMKPDKRNISASLFVRHIILTLFSLPCYKYKVSSIAFFPERVRSLSYPNYNILSFFP